MQSNIKILAFLVLMLSAGCVSHSKYHKANFDQINITKERIYCDTLIYANEIQWGERGEDVVYIIRDYGVDIEIIKKECRSRGALLKGVKAIMCIDKKRKNTDALTEDRAVIVGACKVYTKICENDLYAYIPIRDIENEEYACTIRYEEIKGKYHIKYGGITMH